VPGENGIRRSKDLRAEIGKFPNSTNERKKMSTKTLRKRIAVVAVSALTVGVLSVMSAPVANADAFATENILFASTSTNDGSRACSILPTTAGGTNYETAYALSTSVGVIATVQSGGTGDAFIMELEGPGVIVAATGSAVISSSTKVYDLSTATGETITIKPTGIGVIKARYFDYASSTKGSLVDMLTINVVATCANKVFSSALSNMRIITSTEATDDSATTTNVDVTDANVVTNSGYGYIGISLRDTYGASLDEDAIIATVRSGDAFVKLGEEATSSSAVPGVGTAKTSVLASTGAQITAQVSQSVADKPTIAVVDISYAGTLVGTKTITFQGVATTIDIKDVTVGTTTGVGYFRAKVLDAAGNALAAKDVENDATANSVAAISAITSGVSQAARTASDGDWSPVAGAANGGQFNCTKGGVTTLNVKHVVDAATTVKKSFAIACGGALDTWTISMDKASYAPGEIATLTVTGKDSLGNLVNSVLDISTVEYSFGGMTFVTAPTTTDSFTSAAGAKTYQLSVGTSLGSYVGTFKIAGSTDTSAKTVQYSVKSSTTTVTNEDVLKSIVSLIASINKQIQALQKLILKRR